MQAKVYLLFAILLILSGSAAAQNYDFAVGARLGYPLSASAKKFITEQGAIEGYIGFRGYTGYNWVSISAAYQQHQALDVEDLTGLNWYYGAGATVYFWSFNDSFLSSENYNSSSLGVQGYLGLEYTFTDDIPLSISLDWVPTIFFNSYTSGFGAGYGSVGVRYVLKE